MSKDFVGSLWSALGIGKNVSNCFKQSTVFLNGPGDALCGAKNTTVIVLLAVI